MKKNILAISILTVVLSVIHCTKLKKEMFVSTGEATSITTTSSDITGNVVDLGEGAIQYGHCYGTSPNLTINNSKTSHGLPIEGGFKSKLTGLNPNTKYYYKAYISSSENTIFGDEKNFSTLAGSVPGAPTIGAATSGNAQATITFSAPTDNGGLVITGYTVISNPGQITTSGIASPIIITGLTNGTSYTFTVTATNANGIGPASSASNSITPATVPGAPAIGTAIGGNAQATISFTAPADNGGSPITGYTVTSSPGGLTGAGVASPVIVTGLINGTSYTFTVTATNASGIGPASSASNSITPATVPGAPIIGIAIGGNAQATISFTAPADNGGSPITGYTVASSPGGLTGTGVASPVIITGLTNGTSYTFTVTATNTNGTSPSSSASNSITPVAPAIPTVTTTAISEIGTTNAIGGGNVTFDGGESVTERGVCWSTSLNPVVTDSKSSNGSGPGVFSCSISGLSPVTSYHVRAYAINSVGTGYGSDVVFTTSATLPTVTTNSISGLTPYSAVSGGNVVSDGGAFITARGVCWSTTQYPTLTNNFTSDGTGTGTYTSNIGSLTKSTTYYLRAYGTNSIGTSYGNQVIFSTPISQVSIVKSFASPGSSPTALEWDGNSLWMVDNLNHFYHLDTLGTVLGSFSFASEVFDLAWDGSNLWVYTANKIQKIDGSGTIISEYPLTWYMGGLAWDGSNLWVSDYNFGKVYKFDNAGNILLSWDSGIFGHPTGMTYNGTNLLIGDSFELYNYIYLFSKTGVNLSSINLDDINLKKIKTFEKKAVAWDGIYIWYSTDGMFEIYKLKVIW